MARFLIFIILFLSAFIIEAATPSQYLVKPTGPYAVSMTKYSWLNNAICPDYFYQESQNWFYSDNPKRCHQFNAYIFYPTNTKSKTYLPYYSDIIQQVQHDIKIKTISPKNRELAQQYIHNLNNIYSHILSKQKIATGKFPLIIFQPGLGFNSNNFQNFIANLVSNGYIVVAIDSAYSSTITTPNGYLEWGPLEIESNGNPTIKGISAALASTHSNLSEVKSDYFEILSRLRTDHSLNPISKHIDMSHISGLGHSMGAISIYQNSFDKSNPIAAMASLDFGQSANKPVYEYTPQLPTLFFRASNDHEYGIERHSSVVFTLKNNDYLVWMKPDNNDINYSKHHGFSDFITIINDTALFTLRNQVYGLPKFNRDQALKPIGTANGYTFTNDINQYLLQFFNYNLKNQPAVNLKKCTSIDSGAKLYCGPTIIK